ncbi:MAG: hypothetical protein AAGU77_00085 [Bacillota bacterium]
MIQVKASGGKGGLPSDWTEEVTATALEAIAKGDAVEYRMYPGVDVFNYGTETLPDACTFFAYTPDNVFRVFQSINNICIQRYVDGAYVTLQTIIPAGGELDYHNGIAITSDGQYIFLTYDPASSNQDRLLIYKTTDWETWSLLYTYTHAVANVKLTKIAMAIDKYILVCTVPRGSFSVSDKAVYAFKFENDTLTPLTITGVSTYSDDSNAVSGGRDCDVSDDGVYWIYTLVNDTTSSAVYMLKRTGDGFANMFAATAIYRLTGSVPNGFGSCAINGVGNQFAFTFGNTPYIKHFSLINDVATELPAPDIAMPGYTNVNPTNFRYKRLAYSKDGNYLFVSGDWIPNVIFYKINGNNLTKLANPATLAGSVSNIYASADGKKVYINNPGDGVLKNYLTGVGAYIIPLISMAETRYLSLNQYTHFGVGMAKTSALEGQPCTATLFKKINDAGV